MKKIIILSFVLFLNACQTMNNYDKNQAIGGDTDKYGCIKAAGQSWSILKNECIQPFNNPDLKLNDPDNETLGVFVYFSEDKSKAEVFAVDLPNGESSIILENVKGGFTSIDGKVRLINMLEGWRFSRR